MTKYYDSRTRGMPNPDLPVSVPDYTNWDSREARYCPYCQIKLSRLIDSSGRNPSWYCGKCVIEYPDRADTKSTSSLSIPKKSSNNERPAVAFPPEPGLAKKDHSVKGTFAELQKRGFKIKNYVESKG